MTHSNPRISNSDYALLAQLRYALRLFLSFSEQAARDAGVTPVQHQALLALRGFGQKEPLSIGELATRLLIRQNTAVGLVQRLIKRGFVARIIDKRDRRCVRLAMLPLGEALLARLSVAHRAELRQIGPRIETLLEGLQRPTDVPKARRITKSNT